MDEPERKPVSVYMVLDNRYTPLTWVARSGQVEVARGLISCGADVDQEDGLGYTPLAWACISRSEEMVKLLIESGADVNLLPRVEIPPIGHACFHNCVEIVQMLINAGADVNYYGHFLSISSGYGYYR